MVVVRVINITQNGTTLVTVNKQHPNKKVAVSEIRTVPWNLV